MSSLFERTVEIAGPAGERYELTVVDLAHGERQIFVTQHTADGDVEELAELSSVEDGRIIVPDVAAQLAELGELYCQCGELLVADPAGSAGVYVHDPELGELAVELEHDHGALPDIGGV
jgi:hypothetical protein